MFVSYTCYFTVMLFLVPLFPLISFTSAVAQATLTVQIGMLRNAGISIGQGGSKKLRAMETY